MSDCIEEAVERLEKARAVSPHPGIASFVVPAGHPERSAMLVELIKVDQEYCWKARDHKLLESYLDEWPELTDQPSAIKQLLEAECLTRAVFDTTVPREEVRRRFPGLSDLLAWEEIEAEVAEERSARTRLKRGQQFRGLRIRGCLGAGSMGIVYRAYHPGLQREVALKIPRVDSTQKTELLERFRREAPLAAGVHHRNVCPVYDAGEEGGICYLVMALIEGPSLATLLEDSSWQMPPRDIARLVHKLADALAAVHSVGIVHRDIKPANVVIDRAGEPLLMDFGLARADSPEIPPSDRPLGIQSAACLTLTGSGRQPGTPCYMAPELFLGDNASPRSDIYSLGLVLYQLLTRQQPFQEKGSLQELAEAVIHQDLPQPRQCSRQIDRRLEAICLTAIARRTEDRYSSAAEMASVLCGYLSSADQPPRISRRLVLAVAPVLALLGVLMMFRINTGMLVLEVEPEDVRVEIDGEEVHLKSPRDDIRLRVGEHQLVITKDGFETRTQSFQVRRNDETEILARLEGAQRPLFDDRFQGNRLNRALWNFGQTNRFSYRGTGKTTHRIDQKNGSLLLEAEAEHEGGWTCTQLIWLDSVQNLCSTDDATVEIEWSAEANLGLAAIELTDGKEPADSEDSRSIRLLSLLGEKYAPLFSQQQRVWIDICGLTRTATVYTQEGIPRGGAAIDLQKLPAWKLRFLTRACTSAGYPPSHVTAQIRRVCATRIPARSSVSGRVIDEIANRGIPGAVVRFGSDKVVSNLDGTFLLRTAPGKQMLHADAAGYEELDPPTLRIEPGRRTQSEVRMRRTHFGYGHVLMSIPLNRLVQSVAISSKDIYFTATQDSGPQTIFRVPIAGGRAGELGTVSLSPAQRGLRDALTTGSPDTVAVGRGMMWADGVIYGIDAWPGRIFRVSTNGELTLVHRLAIDWPEGIVFDGTRFWFLENSNIDNRYGIRAIDSKTGRIEVSVPSRDTKIFGLAKGLGRFWVSSLAGHVYEIDIDQAIDNKSLEAGVVNRFPGEYCRLGFGDGCLWGLDREAQRLCKIKVR